MIVYILAKIKRQVKILRKQSLKVSNDALLTSGNSAVIIKCKYLNTFLKINLFNKDQQLIHLLQINFKNKQMERWNFSYFKNPRLYTGSLRILNT